MSLLVKVVGGPQLDEVSLKGGALKFSTGRARPIFESMRARNSSLNDAGLYRVLTNWTNGYLQVTADSDEPVKAAKTPVMAHLPGEHNQQNHAGSNAGIDGIDLMSGDNYRDLYGETLDEENVDLGDGMYATARVFTNGDSHLVVDVGADEYQVLGELNSDEMRQLADHIEDVLAYDPDDEDSQLLDEIEGEYGLTVGVDDAGDVYVSAPSGGWLELSPGNAQRVADALKSVADIADEADVDDTAVAAAAPVVAHGTHNQKTHGRRFSVPGDRSSGLRPSRREQERARRAADAAEELEGLRQSVARAQKFAKDAAKDSTPEGQPTAAPTRMTSGQYTRVLKDENIRLHLLDGKSEREAKALARPKASTDDLKSRNTELRKVLRAKGIDYRTDEQKRADDAEKNTLLEEVERLAVAGGYDGPAKRAGASKMSKQELRKFIADVKDFQRRQKAKRDAESKGAAAQAAFDAAEANGRATSRQVGYIVGLLRERARSGEGGGIVDGPTSSADIRKMSKAEASAYINSLRGGY